MEGEGRSPALPPWPSDTPASNTMVVVAGGKRGRDGRVPPGKWAGQISRRRSGRKAAWMAGREKGAGSPTSASDLGHLNSYQLCLISVSGSGVVFCWVFGGYFASGEILEWGTKKKCNLSF